MREPIDHRTAIDFLEPEEIKNDYREAAREFYRVMTAAALYILKQKNKTLATYGVCYALGVSEICELSMRERCEAMGYSHNAMSRHCINFQRLINIDK
jgi:hypothetical protein